MDDQIEKCQTPELSYLNWHHDAEKRIENGEEQSWCKVCKRWKWQDLLCEISEVER